MSDIFFLKLSQNVSITVDTTLKTVFSPTDTTVVDEFFEKKKRINPMLFDGTVFVVHFFSKERIILKPVSYKYVYASLHNPFLRKAYSLYPLAITGILLGQKGVFLAKRSRSVATDQGLYECCPSGIVDADCIDTTGVADLKKCFYKECLEELFYTPDPSTPITPTGALWDPSRGTFDICFVLPVDDSFHPFLNRREYVDSLWSSEIKDHPIGPTTKKILKNFL